MKALLLGTITTALLAAAPAHAGGSFDWHIGFGSSSRHHSNHHVQVRSHGHYDSHRSVQRHRSHAPVYRSACDSRPRGHWETVQREVWVDGYWTHERLPCGRSVRRWTPGYRKCVSERVWVSY